MRIAVPARLDPGAARLRGGDVVALSGLTMGVSWNARFLAPAGFDRGRAQDRLQATLNAVVGQMSGWEDASTLSRFNNAPAGTTYALPSPMFEVVERAGHWARESGGAFDPTLAALVDLWGFGPAGAVDVAPSDDIIAQALAHSGWERLAFDPATRTIRQPGGLALDLSGIAKGHGLDLAGRALRDLDVGDYLIEIGGELIGAGVKANGEPWWVDVEPPPGVALEPLRIALHGLAVATSGDYRRFREDGGRRLGHSLDPRTGRPVENGVVSVTALAKTGMDADAIATVLTILGPERSLAFARERDIAAQIVRLGARGPEEILTPALEEMLA